MPTKLTVNLPDETVAALKNIADSYGTTATEALRQIIENERFLHEETRSGSRVLLERPNDRNLREVIFNSSRSKNSNR